MLAPTALRVRLQAHQSQLPEMLADLETHLAIQHDRHDQLTRRYHRLESQTERLTNPETVRGQRLYAQYDVVTAQHAESETNLEDLENQVIEPLREARDVLGRLLS